MIGIMSAMHEELNLIVEMLSDVTEEKIGRKVVTLGKLNNKNVVVVFSGWGKVAAATTSTMLIERYNIAELIFTGVAGCVQPDLYIGDIVIGSSFVQHDMDCAGVLGIKRFEIPLVSLTEIPSDKNLQLKSEQAAKKYLTKDLTGDVSKSDLNSLGITRPKIVSGLIGSGDQFISSQVKLDELKASLPTLLVVEMEGAAVAQVAYEYNLPFIVIRIVSDKANDDSLTDFPLFIEKVASHFTAGVIKRLI